MLTQERQFSLVLVVQQPALSHADRHRTSGVYYETILIHQFLLEVEFKGEQPPGGCYEHLQPSGSISAQMSRPRPGGLFPCITVGRGLLRQLRVAGAWGCYNDRRMPVQQ
jgi:hypothetical protein